jgi:hypothetical protein
MSLPEVERYVKTHKLYKDVSIVIPRPYDDVQNP